MSKFFGIDVSKHNGSIDWTAVKKSGVDFAIIRAGYGKVASQIDPRFVENYYGCKNNNIPCGVYWYSYAKTVAEAKLEAEACLSAIAGKQFEYPVYFDMEEQTQVALGKSLCSDIAAAFCDILEKNKFWVGLYSFDSWFNSNWHADFQKRYSCWTARVENIAPVHCSNYDMWQYSWKGNVNGISTVVDLNYCYKDFPSLIKNAGLNGFSKNSAKVYEISGTKKNMSSADADKLAYKLANDLQMTVVKKEL